MMRGLAAFLYLVLILVTGCRPAPGPGEEPLSSPGATAPAPVTRTASPPPTPDIESQIARFNTPRSAVRTSVAPTREQRGLSDSNLALELPTAPTPEAIDDTKLRTLREQAEYSASAADWRKVAERALEVQDFSSAQQAFAIEAKIYRDKGHIQAAIAEEIKAAQYETVVEFYLTQAAPTGQKRERLEPESGCMVGAFIDRDFNLETLHYESQTHGNIDDFNRLTGKKHANFFMYRAFGKPFPTSWAQYVKSKGAMVNIAWEPKNTEEVYDDEYLNRFIDAAAALDHPVMLRFASEMNGDWTGYSGDPEAYKKAFRHVYRQTRRAPKVAMMWCPNTVPQADIEKYYPGDDYVDWVGVNFYSVPFLDNDPLRPGDKIHPTDHLKYVYDKYSAQKPIAIGEWAASRKSSLSPEDLTSFACDKLAQLYSSLPTRFPRVKLVNWYDCDNMTHAKEERQLNNFQLTGSKELVDFYNRAVNHPHFLGAHQPSAKSRYQLVTKVESLAESDEIKIFAKSYDPHLKIYFRVGQTVLKASDDPLNWSVRGSELSGSGDLEALVYDSKDRFVAAQKLAFRRKD